jgi:serine/threonine protein kinase
MTWLSDGTLDHLRRVAESPDFSGTRYELRSLLGRGGMGAVYLAGDRELGREVAVKVLDTVTPDAAARLRQEARILGRLEHPGIVPIHDVGTLPDGRVYYVMKRVRGQRIDAHVRAGRSIPDLLGVFERICDTVAFAHARGVIHRDLKPENIMVGEFGEVLVLDWGVAKVLHGSDPANAAADAEPGRSGPATGHGTVLGTPGYMAPEQARGDGAIDERADVFGLGAILQFMLTGLPPGSQDGSAGLPRALRAIWAKAQAPDPGERYPDVGALGRDVSRYRAGAAVEAHAEGPGERLARFARAYRVPIVLVLSYLAMRLALLWLGRA